MGSQSYLSLKTKLNNIPLKMYTFYDYYFNGNQ